MEDKEAKSKGGRPALGEDKKSRVVSLRFSPAQYAAMEKRAAGTQMTMAEYLEQICMKGHVKALYTPQAQEELRKLIGLSNNVNQLARSAHMQGVKPLAERLNVLLDEIDEIIKKYKP